MSSHKFGLELKKRELGGGGVGAANLLLHPHAAENDNVLMIVTLKGH
jgi:hypothetical protein